MIAFPASVIAFPLVGSYSPVQQQGVLRHTALKGRPRYELKDTEASFVTQIMLDTDRQGFAAFQSFWQAIGYGTDWFTMELTFDALATSTYEVHATGSFETSMTGPALINITIPVEIRG